MKQQGNNYLKKSQQFRNSAMSSNPSGYPNPHLAPVPQGPPYSNYGGLYPEHSQPYPQQQQSLNASSSYIGPTASYNNNGASPIARTATPSFTSSDSSFSGMPPRPQPIDSRASSTPEFQPLPKSLITPTMQQLQFAPSTPAQRVKPSSMADRIITRSADEETEDGRIRNREASQKIRDAWIYKQIRARQVSLKLDKCRRSVNEAVTKSFLATRTNLLNTENLVSLSGHGTLMPKLPKTWRLGCVTIGAHRTSIHLTLLWLDSRRLWI